MLLQEVENERVMNDIAEGLGPEYRVRVSGETGAPASMDVVVISRGSLVEVVRHRRRDIPLPNGGTTRFTREFLEVHLALDGARVIVFVAHYKAKTDDDPARRLAEANASLAIINAVVAEHPEALVVFGGDLNDTPGSPPINALESSGQLLPVARDIPEEWAWTFRFRGQNHLIDHLYVARDASGSYVQGSARTHHEHRAPPASDHASLSARFDLPR